MDKKWDGNYVIMLVLTHGFQFRHSNDMNIKHCNQGMMVKLDINANNLIVTENSVNVGLSIMN